MLLLIYLRFITVTLFGAGSPELRRKNFILSRVVYGRPNDALQTVTKFSRYFNSEVAVTDMDI